MVRDGRAAGEQHFYIIEAWNVTRLAFLNVDYVPRSYFPVPLEETSAFFALLLALFVLCYTLRDPDFRHNSS